MLSKTTDRTTDLKCKTERPKAHQSRALLSSSPFSRRRQQRASPRNQEKVSSLVVGTNPVFLSSSTQNLRDNGPTICLSNLCHGPGTMLSTRGHLQGLPACPSPTQVKQSLSPLLLKFCCFLLNNKLSLSFISPCLCFHVRVP
ncbi:uncharacterized [Tachysurus ichikawai]